MKQKKPQMATAEVRLPTEVADRLRGIAVLAGVTVSQVASVAVATELVRLRAVRLYAVRDRYEWYTCTPEGRAAGIASHKAIRHSPSQRRYRRFLELRECWPDMTFRQFLKQSASTVRDEP